MTLDQSVGLDAPAGRAIAFSAATRNSLVVLPLAFAVPGAMPLLPAIVVAQTMVELAENPHERSAAVVHHREAWRTLDTRKGTGSGTEPVG